MLSVQDLHKSYQVGKTTYEVLKGVSLEVAKGEFVAVMGPSGSGKTTLLNCISCYIPADSGSIRLGSQELARLDEDTLAAVRNKKLGFVFQDFLLLDGLTVRDNILLPRIIAGETGGDMEQAADRLCGIFGIGAIRNKYPAEISGGEKQRTAVARALINHPMLLLADEPTGNLDSRSSRAVIDAFLQAKADLEATQADLETQKTALDGKTNELAQNISQTDANISAADAEIEANKAALIEANKAVDKAAAELDAALNAANQAYGNASIQCSLDFGRPLATYKYVSCYFGGNGHRGTDYAAPGGTEIYAVSGGVVTAAAYHWSWGYYVQVYHGKDDNGNTYSTLYAHMNSAPVVSVGQPVEKGKVLGYVGSTGNSTGNHLHLEMKVNNVLVNVMNYLS